MVVEEAFGWHVPFSTGSVSDLKLLLQLTDLLHNVIILIFDRFPLVVELKF